MGWRALLRSSAISSSVAAVFLVACSSASTPSADPAEASGGHAGASHGADAAAPSATPLRAGERFLEIRMPEPYVPAAPNGGTDEYRCFVVDPGLTESAFLTGSQFLRQNADIVHHAIFFRISPARARAAHALDATTPGQGWTCFGADGVEDVSAWVGHWAPGAEETLLGTDLGYPMPTGSLIVMQVHYNLLPAGGGAGPSDRSGIRLRLTDGSSATRPLDTALLPAPVELPCTDVEAGPLCDRTAAIADVTQRFGEEIGQTEDELLRTCGQTEPQPGATQRCDYPAPQDMTIYAAAGHMHLLGRSITVRLNPGTTGARTLLDIPVYDFDDQAIRPLATPVSVEAGDLLRVTCTHDAGLRRQLPALAALPPRYVVWGDGTTDEMCLGLLVVGGPIS